MHYKIIISKAGDFEIWLSDVRGQLLMLIGTCSNYRKAIRLGNAKIRKLKAIQRNPAIRTAKLVQL